ncbi:MAG: DUF2924 domain-containing protein [Stutzerimonas stutzeri]|nr:MAG: DUF2924 domain-containing protein [Stutzerimonas stutzeri]
MKPDARVGALAAMKPTQIKAEWTKLRGGPPPPVSANLLARALAHDIQCTAQGSELAERVRQQLMGGYLASPATPALAPGTQLVREWGGESHHVLMEDKGRCNYRGRSFPSLSALARHITGAHWSGPRFFGIRP